MVPLNLHSLESKYSGSYINVSIAAWIKITIYYLNNKIIKKGINL